MRETTDRYALLVSIVTLATVCAPRAWGQALPDQLLDRVSVVSPAAVLEMSFDDTSRVPQFETPPVSAGQVSSCQLTATRGLFCLDQSNGIKGRVVRQWNPVETGSDRIVFSCEDSALGFDTKGTVETCTALTVGDDGSIWVAGKKKSTYSLAKVVEKEGTCANGEGWYDLQQEPTTQYCFKEYARDRPLLVDITATKLVLPGQRQCAGVIGLELRRTLRFFADPELNPDENDCPTLAEEPVAIATSKTWGLRGPELLQSVSLFTFRPESPESGELQDWVSVALAASTAGRILAKDTTDLELVATPVFDVPSERASRSTLFQPRQCVAGGDNQYGIRAAIRTGRVFVTDYQWCEVLALEPTVPGNPLSGLRNVVVDGVDLTLSTFACPYPGATQDDGTPCTSAASYPPLQPTLAPGDSLDLSKCTGSCAIVRTQQGDAAASLSQVRLISSETGATIFQIVDIPDCRWLAQDGLPLPEICDGAIVGSGDAREQSLDVSKLLPDEVTDQFVRNPLPAMLVSPEYRAQVRGKPAVAPRYYFDAFFAILEPGVVFKDTFELEFFVELLSGSGTSLGCESSYPTNEWPVSVSSLLQWDVMLRISENYPTIVGPDDAPALGFGDILSNTGCGSSKGGGPSLSLYAFNLELTDGSEIVFARQVKSLFYGLYEAQAQTACRAVREDGNAAGTTPLTASACATLYAQWDGARDKLSKCMLASDYPKQSEAVRNCQAFSSQIDGYLASLTSTPACVDASSCTDRGNRRGELMVRVMVLKHVFNDRFLPSIPSEGFRDPGYDAVMILPARPPL